jgi:hypothetical protein
MRFPAASAVGYVLSSLRDFLAFRASALLRDKIEFGGSSTFSQGAMNSQEINSDVPR